MIDRNRYFVFNKESDYKRGFLSNITCSSSGIKIQNPASGEAAVFYSRVLDSREKEAQWHRIVIDSESLGDASIRFTFFVNDARFFKYDGIDTEIEDFIKSDQIGYEEKERQLRAYKVKTAFNPVDMLLSEAQGRYLWFRVELFSQGGESPMISKIKIYLRNQAWISYLPEIYQGKGNGRSFIERYLSIFQSIYEDMEETIDHVSRYFDPDVADPEVLRWLAGWIDVDDAYIWTEEKLRYLVSSGVNLYKRRGTRNSISEMVELYTGQKPYIVEHFEIDRYKNNDKMTNLLQMLYGDNAYQFSIVVNEECVPTSKEYKTLVKIIESVKPANMEANLVVLKPYIFLSKYSYLGINSVLGSYRPADLDGFSALPFTNVADTRPDNTLL